MSSAYASRAAVDPLSAALKLTPLSSSTQSHMRRVYTTLFAAVGCAAAGAAVQQRLSLPSSGFLCALLVLGSVFYFLSLPPRHARRLPAFLALAAANGYATGPLLSLVAEIDPAIAPLALAASASIFLCLSGAAVFSRRRHWLYLGGLLASSITALFWIGVVNMFVRSAAAFSLQLYVGLVVFCGYVVYDSQIIIEKVENGDKDHVQHAFDLFIDLAAIFKRILIIMAKNNLKKREEEDKRRRR